MQRLLSLIVFVLAPVLAEAAPALLDFEVVERVAHDPTRFTQGLAVEGDWFYESSGRYGQSYVIRYHRGDDSAQTRSDLPDEIFAEGLALIGDRLYLLSWRAGIARVYGKESLRLLKSIPYEGEGWGLAYDGEHLILSDGSEQLTFLSPKDFSVVRTITAHAGEQRFSNLNELEFAKGLIWANQWKQTKILGIDPSDGSVKAIVDVATLQREAAASNWESVANGIAYDEAREGFWVTGKYWRYRYLLNWSPREN